MFLIRSEEIFSFEAILYMRLFGESFAVAGLLRGGLLVIVAFLVPGEYRLSFIPAAADLIILDLTIDFLAAQK